LLNDCYDLKIGASLSLSWSQAAKKIYTGRKAKLFAAISTYSLLNDEQCNKVLDILEESNKLKEIEIALRPLLLFYPDSPLNFLFRRKLYKSRSNASVLKRFKKVLSCLFDRSGKPATFAQANLIYIAICTDVLEVPRDSVISRFPNIIDYPDTDESGQIASSIRASVTGFFGASSDGFDIIPGTSWPSYLWNRGLIIEKCQID